MSEVVEGRFTLDREAAREKLSRYQLANPRAYVLELVAAAALQGATRVDFEIGRRGVKASFDGLPFPGEELQRIDVAAFEGAEGALRHLAVGLTAALALAPAEVTVHSGNLSFDLKTGRLGPRRGEGPTVVTVRHPLRTTFLGLFGRSREQELLRQHCRWARFGVFLDGERISQGYERFAELGVVLFEGGIGGVLPGHPPRAFLVQHGVLVETVPLELGPVPYCAVAEADALRRDLSHAAFVRDAEFAAVLERIQAARQASLARLARQLRKDDVLAPLVQKELFQCEGLEAALASPLADVPAWRSAHSEERLSLRQLAELETIPYSLEISDEPLDGFPHVLLGVEVQGLNRLLGDRVRNVTRRVRRQRSRSVNRERWRAFPHEPRLPGKAWLIRRPLPAGEIGLSSDGSSSRIRLVKDGCLLNTLYCSNWPPGIDAVVCRDFTPSSNYDGVVRDEILEEALRTVVEAVPSLFESITRREAVKGYLQAVSQKVPPLEQYGYESEPWPLGELERFPWVPTAAGGHLSLADLRTRSRWRWVPPGVRKRDKSVLRLGPPEVELLSRLLGSGALEEVKSSAPPAAVPPSDHSAFLVALRRELHRAGFPIGNVELATEAGEYAACVSSGGFRLDLRHPLVARAVRDYACEPILLTFVISLLYTAVNRTRREVSDEDERKLQHRLIELALGEAPAQPTLEGEVNGLLEPLVRLGVATGWASGGSVQFYVGGPPGQGILAGEAAAGPNFEFCLPERWLDGTEHRLWACCAGVVLPGSPRLFVSAARSPTAPVGRVESIDARGLVKGWCVDRNTPEQAVGIHFYLDGPSGHGEFVGGVAADKPRPDLAENIGFPGHHGFEFRLSAEFLDGSPHELYVYGLDTDGKADNPQLSGSPLSF